LVVPAGKLGFVSQILKKIREPFHEIGRVVARRSVRSAKVIYS
jgi:hypothetical protein